MPAYPGRDSVIYLSANGVSVATKVVGLNKWTINRQTDKYETTAFGDVNKTYVQGLPDLQGSFAGVWVETESKPFTGSSSAAGVYFYFYPSANAPAKFWAGPAFLDVSMDVPVSGAVTISGSFAAAGSWLMNF